MIGERAIVGTALGRAAMPYPAALDALLARMG
jgi:hypothetical protein